jgi:hypothetical protein
MLKFIIFLFIPSLVFGGLKKMDENFIHGKLIIPSDTPKALVIFYPPATGDKGHQAEEAKKLKELNYASLLYDPPYRKNMSKGGLADLNGEKELWKEAREHFPKVVQDFKKHLGSEQMKIFVVGKNIGGSVAAYSVDSSVNCLIITGSVPILSTFWVTSEHPVAREARKDISNQQLKRFQNEMKVFDLTETVLGLRQKVLIQLGTKDPWIEKQQADTLKNKISKNTMIQWIEDDHIMATENSVTQRQKFLKECD